ncbi:hypothetical protein DKT68_02175 [Micromonospora acroterricola]|uniref:Lipoprotein n=1 Tax=Micromonospora acroterricola TaxID=2202421 RepID=A0A317DGI2_9ACTN|nr:hypothetical protein [Micromonospora acroterricola]PWR12836.1 hypothetical protein DKT68_02175 [Micromonospora acroterricola]
MRSGRTVLAVALLGVALGGCAGQGSGPDAGDDPGPARIIERWTSCAEAAPRAGAGVVLPAPDGAEPLPTGEDPAIGRIDPAFTPVTAVLCGREIRPRPGGGEEQVATERRADEIGALVDALRLPDRRPDGEIACTLDMVIPPWLALLDERGRWLRPYLPADACGKPRAEVRAALDGLRLTTVDSRTVGQVESAAAAAAGCAQRWADMVWVETTMGRPGPPAPATVPAAEPLRLCVYQVPASERGGGKPAGDFAYGGPLPPDRQAAVLRALAAAGPATACATPASRFAVLRPLDGTGGPDRYVELDGCRRFLVVPPAGGPQLGQGDAALAELLRR